MLAPGLKAAPNGRAIAFPVPQAGPWWADHRSALQLSAVPTLDSRYRSGSRRASPTPSPLAAVEEHGLQ